MSLQSLRETRLRGLCPPEVFVVQRACPRPDWRWLRDDVQVVWMSPRRDVRAYDLRPLVGLSVVALVERLAEGLTTVAPAVKRAGGKLVGMADGADARVWRRHPWARRLHELAGDEWAELIKPVLRSDWMTFFGDEYAIA